MMNDGKTRYLQVVMSLYLPYYLLFITEYKYRQSNPGKV